MSRRYHDVPLFAARSLLGLPDALRRILAKWDTLDDELCDEYRDHVYWLLFAADDFGVGAEDTFLELLALAPEVHRVMGVDMAAEPALVRFAGPEDALPCPKCGRAGERAFPGGQCGLCWCMACGPAWPCTCGGESPDDERPENGAGTP